MIGTEIGVDLGSYSIKIFSAGRGVVLNEPFVIAYSDNDKIVGIGKKAYDMWEKNSDKFRIVHPVVNGIVSEFTSASHILSYYLAKTCRNAVLKPNVIIGVPSTITNLEKMTIFELASASGAGRTYLIEQSLAAAIGAGVSDDSPKATMVVDIGSGTTNIAVVSLGRIVESKSVNIAGDAFNDALIRYFRRERDIIIGNKTAEDIKIRIGSATLRGVELGITSKGKNYITEMPMLFEANSTETFCAIKQCLDKIVDEIKTVLENVSPEICADIIDNGIILTGGSAHLRNIDKYFANEIKVKTKVAGEPEKCAALGIGSAFSFLDNLSDDGYITKSGIKE